MAKPTHLDARGRARMVDVGGKKETFRTATARAEVILSAKTLSKVLEGNVAKGDVLAAARIAGIMGGKKTPEIIPLTHPIAIDSMEVDLDPDTDLPGLRIQATVKTTGKTGVEMEALTAVTAAALTVYDMLKSLERGIRITDIRLVHKAGGESGEYHGE